MFFEIINPLNFSGWNELVLNTTGYSFFHTSNWARVLHETYHYQPVYFTLLAHGQISSLIPLMEINSFITGKRGISLPFSDFCNPIVSNKYDFQKTLETICEYGQKSGWHYVEFRGDNGLFRNEGPSACFYEHRLELSNDSNQVFSNFRDTTKRNIRKAKREGVGIEILNTLRATEQYYHLHCITRKRQGVPPQPFNFFKNIYKNVLSKNLGFIILAYYLNEIIAGAVFFHFGEKAIYKFGASKTEFFSLRPNDLVMWQAIKWYCEKGFRAFSFGRTALENEGLRKFKCGWGSKEYLIKYFKYSYSEKSFIQDRQKVGELQKKIFQKTPVPLLKFLGTIFYKHNA